MLAKKCFLVGIFTLLSLSLAISAQPLHPATGEPLMMDCLRGTPAAIDGDLSDWNLDAMTPAVLDAVEQLSSGQDIWTGPEDCSAEFYMLWDDVNIYMAVVVKDEKLAMNKTGADIWNSDCVEMFFATTEAEAEHSWTNPTIHYQYGFNANNQTWNWCNMHGPGQSVPDYLQAASSITADGYICEVSIEYAQMSALDFSAGNTIGIHPCIDDTDIDDGDTEYQMSWTGLAAHDQSMGFGHMLLSADSVPEPASANVVLRVDFNSNQDGGGDSTTAGDPGLSEAAHNQEGWSSYHANHEVIDEFATADYGGITVTPDWPNTTDNRVRQSIDRSSGNDINWDDAAGDLNLVTDWIGIDTRAGNGGNGDWDGTTGTPTYMTLALGGLAAGNYNWTSFHHDTEHCHGPFAVWLSTDGGVTFTQLDDGVMTDSTEGGTPDSGATEVGPDANTLSSTYRISFSADGVNDVVLRFAPYSEGAVHRQIWGMNGFVLELVLPVDPGTEGLAAYYALENDVLDGSGNGNDGTIVGNPTYIPGVLGTAMEFHGLGAAGGGGDYIDCGSGASLDITGPISLALWIRPDADDPEGQGTETAPMAKAMSGMSPSWSYQVRYGWGSPQPYMAFTFNTSPRAWAYVGQNLVQGEWAHIACAHDGETLKCYLNGAETDSTPMGQITSSPAPVLIGSDGWGCDWIGGIDEVAIYNRGLSEGEMLYLAGYRADADGADPSLSIYYTFDEVSDIVADQSGKGHDGVVVGDVSAVAEGILAGAAQFATGSYLDLDGPNIPAEDIPTSAMTLAAWINCENTGGDHEIFSARASDNTWLIHPEPKSSGDIRWLLRSYGGTTIFQIRAGTMTWGEWLHFAGTYDKASAKAALYINGELIQEMDVENPADIAGDWDQGARVGLTIDDARPFTGLMDEFRMYTRALSQEEIAGL